MNATKMLETHKIMEYQFYSICMTFFFSGIIVWGNPVQDILEDGRLLLQQAAGSDGSGLVRYQLFSYYLVSLI